MEQYQPRITVLVYLCVVAPTGGRNPNGSNILINGVIDPLHVSYLGSPIALIGIRLKAGASPAAAERLVNTAILAQAAEIERDGTGLMPDGSVPALISWEPDSINSPALANAMRSGLPPVPFTVKTNVQKYLLQSGLYELDLSAVHDAGLRAELQGFVPAAAPPARAPQIDERWWGQAVAALSDASQATLYPSRPMSYHRMTDVILGKRLYVTEKPMIRKLTRQGNSICLVIEKQLRELLEITTDTPLKISVEGRKLIIEPMTEEEARRAI